MQHPPHIDIRVANFHVEGLGIIRKKHIKNPVRDVGGSIRRSGNLNGSGRNFSAQYLWKMIRKKTRLRSVATPQIN